MFKLLELHKNPEKEYSKPQGYECIKLKIEHLAKRAEKKAEDKSKDLPEARSNSDDSKSDASDNESFDDEDPELEDDDVGDSHPDR